MPAAGGHRGLDRVGVGHGHDGLPRVELDQSADGRGHPGLHLEEGLAPGKPESARASAGPGSTRASWPERFSWAPVHCAEVALEEPPLGPDPQPESPGDGLGRLGGALQRRGVDGRRAPAGPVRRAPAIRSATASAWAWPSSERWRPGARPGSTWPVVGVLPWRTRRTTVGRRGLPSAGHARSPYSVHGHRPDRRSPDRSGPAGASIGGRWRHGHPVGRVGTAPAGQGLAPRPRTRP